MKERPDQSNDEFNGLLKMIVTLDPVERIVDYMVTRLDAKKKPFKQIVTATNDMDDRQRKLISSLFKTILERKDAWATSCKEELLGCPKETQQLFIEVVNDLKVDEMKIAETEKQRKKRIIEIMEKDREAYKTKREENWMISLGRSSSEEFLAYYKKITKPSTDLLYRDQLRFLEVNGRKSAIEQLKSKHTPVKRRLVIETLNVYIFDIEDSLVYLDSYLQDTRPISKIARVLDDMIIDVACKLFFYKDLKQFHQPNCLYFKAFDDNSDLRYYDFADDRLRRRDPRPDDLDMGRERAYRSRIMMQTYSDPDHLLRYYSPEFKEHLERVKMDLDEACKGLNSLSSSILTLLSGQPNTRLYIIAPRSIPRLLALCSAMGINQYFPAQNIYSSLPFGRRWCLEDIRARYPHDVNLVVCGGHREVEEDARCIGGQYFKIKGLSDMMYFAQKIDLHK